MTNSDEDVMEANQTNASPDTQATNNSRRGRRRRRQQQRQEAIAQISMLARQRQFSSIISHRRRQQHQPLPFILPIWMARKLDSVASQVVDGNRRGLGVRNDNVTMQSLDSNSNLGYVSQLWSIVRGLVSRGPSYDSVATTPSRSSSRHRNDGDEADIEMGRDIQRGEGGLELLQLSPPSRSDSSQSNDVGGLRRRSPTRRDNPLPLQHSPSSSSSSTNNSSSRRRRRTSDPPAFPNASSNVSNSALRLQPQLSSPRRRRNSFESDNNDSDNDNISTSSSDTDSDESSTSSSSSDDSDNYRTNHNTGNEGCSQQNLYGVMRLSFSIAVLHIFILISLHVTYVGPHAFHKQTREVPINGNSDASMRKLILGNPVVEASDNQQDKAENTRTIYNCISYALATRPVEERSTYFGEIEKENATEDDGKKSRMRRGLLTEANNDDEISVIDDLRVLLGEDDDIDEAEEAKRDSPIMPLLGKDEVLQIKIMYGKGCTGQCSRVRNVEYPIAESDAKKDENNSVIVADGQVEYNDGGEVQDGQHTRGLKQNKKDYRINNNGTVDQYSSPEYWEKPHYRFAIDDALLYLDEKAALLHKITLVNVTVTERCLSTGSDDGK